MTHFNFTSEGNGMAVVGSNGAAGSKFGWLACICAPNCVPNCSCSAAILSWAAAKAAASSSKMGKIKSIRIKIDYNKK